MRKLSRRHQNLLIMRARAGCCKGKKADRDAAVLQQARRQQAQSGFEKWRSQLPEVERRTYHDDRLRITTPPASFSLTSNYKETLAFLLAIRGNRSVNGMRNKFHAWRGLLDLAAIEEMDPATALVLAAELDHWRSRDVRTFESTWHENIRQLFEQSGLFELLNLRAGTVLSKPSAGSTRQTLKYRRGTLPDGRQADELRAELVALVGGEFGPRVHINNALTEAMTNAHHHAYPADALWWPTKVSPDWWAGGAWDPDNRTTHMMIYDRGVGIPNTLPRSKHWISAIPILDRLDPERSDAALIEAALELRRTSTSIAGRGRGLYEMAEWIEKTGTGFLRIMSGRGQVLYRPGGRKERIKLPVSFCGTLVEWEIHHGA